MARERRPKIPKTTMTVSPPNFVAGPLGDVRTTTLNQAIRIAAVVLRDAATEVAALLKPDEWRTTATALGRCALDPEIPTPGYVIARLVETEQGRAGNKDAKALQSLIKRLESLTYLQAWACVIACQFRFAHKEQFSEDDPWWSIPFRENLLAQQE